MQIQCQTLSEVSNRKTAIGDGNTLSCAAGTTCSSTKHIPSSKAVAAAAERQWSNKGPAPHRQCADFDLTAVARRRRGVGELDSSSSGYLQASSHASQLLLADGQCTLNATRTTLSARQVSLDLMLEIPPASFLRSATPLGAIAVDTTRAR